MKEREGGENDWILAVELESRVAARWEEYGIGIPYLDDERRELLTMEQLSKRLPDV
jgi:4-hydroxy-3-polyprenylbenzoate decarboxylase